MHRLSFVMSDVSLCGRDIQMPSSTQNAIPVVANDILGGANKLVNCEVGLTRAAARAIAMPPKKENARVKTLHPTMSEKPQAVENRVPLTTERREKNSIKQITAAEQ